MKLSDEKDKNAELRSKVKSLTNQINKSKLMTSLSDLPPTAVDSDASVDMTRSKASTATAGQESNWIRLTMIL